MLDIYGIGLMVATPVGGNLPTPATPVRFLTIQDCSVEISQKLEKLMGQMKGPDDVKPSDMEIKGKGTFAKLTPDALNLLAGDTVSTGVKVNAIDEAHSVPGSVAYTVTVTNATTFTEDLGVRYAATGQPLQQVTAGAEALGTYSVVQTGGGKGVYTFAIADEGVAMLFTYAYTATTGRSLLVTNHVQGYGPYFDLWLSPGASNPTALTGNNGCHIFQAYVSKMSRPYKRNGYVISDFEYESFPNAAGNWYEEFYLN